MTGAALTTARFSVGTGKPSVFSMDTLSQFTTIVQEGQRCSSDDKATAVELELYAALYQCVVQHGLQVGQTKAQFHNWKAKYEDRSYACPTSE